MKKEFKIILINIIIICAYMMIFPNKSNAVTNQELENLNYDVVITANGDINVTETWDIKIEETRTLYKNFEIDKDKYSKISNVYVEEITGNTSNKFVQTNSYNYYVDTGKYYALNLNQNMFEIAWGTNWSDQKEEKKYKISYTINGGITNYADCSEFYWQFLGDEFKIPAKKIKGTITLPSGIQKKSDIRVWGHIESLNGNIKVKNTNEIEFKVNNYKGNQYLEVRLLLPPNIVNNTERTYNIEALDSILREEKSNASSANMTRIFRIILTVVVGVLAVGIIYFELKSIKKYVKMIKDNKSQTIQPEINYEYFRDIPNENISPGQAVFLMNSKNEPVHGDFSNIFAATVLKLAYKKYFELKVKEMEDGKKISYMEFSKKAAEYKFKKKYGAERTEIDLQPDEIEILDYILKIAKEENKLAIQNINAHIKENEANAEEFIELIEKVQDKIEVAQKVNGNINSNSDKEIKKYHEEIALNMVILLAIFGLAGLTYVMSLGILGIFPIINLILLHRAKKSLSYLSQNGIDESNKLGALKRYIEDYSLLNQKDMLSLEVWEYFLIYATAFGVSKEVLKQLETQYKENEVKEIYQDYGEIDLVDFEKFQEKLHNSIEYAFDSIKNTSFDFSSSQGFGGGFSARRWKWRRCRPVEEEGNFLN